MIEANPLKFYVAKFFFLFFALLQWFAAATLLILFDLSPQNFFISLVFVTLGLIFFFLFVLVSEKIKRVAVGKNKIVIIEGDKNSRFGWPEVKSLKIIRFVNLYKLRLRGKKNPVYFFPAKNIDPAFGLMAKGTSKLGSIVEKRRRNTV